MKVLGLSIILILCFSTVPLSFSEYKSDNTPSLIHGLPASDYTKILDRYCSFNFMTEIYLNHTITSGNLKKVCSQDYSHFYFELDSVNDDGFLILDIPKDIFAPRDIFNAWVFSPYSNDESVGHLYIRFYFSVEHLENNPLTVKGIQDGSYLLITKIKSYDTFDRYKIPILKGDVFFDMVFSVNGTPHDNYNPQKYTEPITAIDLESISIHKTTSSEIQKIDRTTKSDDDLSCKSNFVPILKPSNDKTVCVKPATAEKLIQRGWIDLR